MKKFEYHVLKINPFWERFEIETAMDQLGSEGWELVSTTVWDSLTAYFKRPL